MKINCKFETVESFKEELVTVQTNLTALSWHKPFN